MLKTSSPLVPIIQHLGISSGDAVAHHRVYSKKRHALCTFAERNARDMRSTEHRGLNQYNSPKRKKSKTNIEPQEQSQVGKQVSTRPVKLDQVSEARKILNRQIVDCVHPEQILALSGKIETTDVVNLGYASYKLAKVSSRLQDKLKIRLRNDPRTQRLSGMVEHCWKDWGDLTTGNVIYAHSILGHGSPSLLPKVETKILENLHTMRPDALSMSLYGLTSGGWISKRFLREIREPLLLWVKSQGDPLKERLISTLMRMYTMNIEETSLQDYELLEVLSQSAKLALRQEAISSQGLAKLAAAFGKLEVNDGELFDMLAEKICKVLDLQYSKSVTMFDVSQMTYGLGKGFGSSVDIPPKTRPDGHIIEYMRKKPIRKEVFQRLIDAARSHNFEFNTKIGLPSFFTGLTHVRFDDQQTMIELSNQIEKEIYLYDSQGISTCMWALTTLRFDSPKTFEALALRMEELLEPKSKKVVFLLSCATMNLTDLPNCMRVCKKMARDLEENVTTGKNAQSLTNLAYALTVLDLLSPKFFRQICLAMSNLRGVSYKELPQLYQADLALRLKHSGSISCTEGSAIDISEFLQECFNLGEIRTAYKIHWQKLMEHDSQVISGFQRQVADVLRDLGIKFSMEADAGDFTVDFVLEGQKLAIEVDGPQHFSLNTLKPLGYHVLRQRLLEQQGWLVIRVPFYEWAKLGNHIEAKNYLLQHLKTNGWKGPHGSSKNNIDPVAIPIPGPPRKEDSKTKNSEEIDVSSPDQRHRSLPPISNQNDNNDVFQAEDSPSMEMSKHESDILSQESIVIKERQKLKARLELLAKKKGTRTAKLDLLSKLAKIQ